MASICQYQHRGRGQILRLIRRSLGAIESIANVFDTGEARIRALAPKRGTKQLSTGQPTRRPQPADAKPSPAPRPAGIGLTVVALIFSPVLPRCFRNREEATRHHDAKKRLASKASCFRSRWYTARPSFAASAPSARALPLLRSFRASHFFAASLSRKSKHAASPKAHFRWALPMRLLPPPTFLPALSCEQRTSRA